MGTSGLTSLLGGGDIKHVVLSSLEYTRLYTPALDIVNYHQIFPITDIHISNSTIMSTVTITYLVYALGLGAPGLITCSFLSMTTFIYLILILINPPFHSVRIKYVD